MRHFEELLRGRESGAGKAITWESAAEVGLVAGPGKAGTSWQALWECCVVVWLVYLGFSSAAAVSAARRDGADCGS